MNVFRMSSGLKINKTKSEAMWIGANTGSSLKPLGLRWPSTSIKCLGILCNVDVDKARNENFTEKIKKLKHVLNMWSQRNLSLKGKVAVLRSIALPQMLYVASVLYTPKWVIEEVTKLMFKFLWSNKKAHVKKEVVIQEIKQGGIKMPDFYSMVKSIKCTWIKRFQNLEICKSDILKDLVIYDNMTIDDITKCKLQINHVKCYSKFYEQVLKYWFDVYSIVKINPFEILSTPLWHNSHVTIGDKPANITSWKINGIVIVKNIFDENGNIVSRHVLENKYNFHIKQMEYNSLIDAVPMEWKKCVKGKPVDSSIKLKNDMVCVKGQWKTILKTQCKDFYWEFVSRLAQAPTAEQKWNKYMYIDQAEWPDLYQLPYLTTRDTALQSFQYRILHRFFPCNYTLSIWYSDHTACCNSCDEVDYLEHYFFSCPQLDIFWGSIERWWLQILEITVSLNSKCVLFGLINFEDDAIIDIFNLCILLGKWHIYNCKQNNENPSFYEYLRLIKSTLDTERIFYILKDNITLFEKKWQLLYQEL